MGELRSLVRHRVEQKKRNSISPINHIEFGLLYKYLSNKKKPTEFMFKEKMRCHSFMPLNRASDLSVADWLPQTHVKNYRIFTCGDTAFRSGGIPIKHSSLHNKF